MYFHIIVRRDFKTKFHLTETVFHTYSQRNTTTMFTSFINDVDKLYLTKRITHDDRFLISCKISLENGAFSFSFTHRTRYNCEYQSISPTNDIVIHYQKIKITIQSANN